jgi:hypothetical protein
LCLECRRGNENIGPLKNIGPIKILPPSKCCLPQNIAQNIYSWNRACLGPLKNLLEGNQKILFLDLIIFLLRKKSR